MKKMLKIGLLIALVAVWIPVSSVAQEREPVKRGVGPANLYLSMKDKIGITKEQEEKLMNVEKEAFGRLEEITAAIAKAQQSLNQLTREEEVDLVKAKELLKSLASLEADGRFVLIEAMALENKVLTKEQREKAREIVQGMSKRPQTPPAPPAKK